MAEFEQRIHCWDVTIRAKECRALACALSHFENARQILVADGDGRVGFVVLQQHVVVGLVALDQIVFQKQRVLFRVDDNVANVANLRDEMLRLKTLLRICEIGRNAALKVLCLAHIYNLPVCVQILIAAGLFGQIADNAF